jgi:DNA-binding GntR family transcriptional regulator
MDTGRYTEPHEIRSRTQHAYRELKTRLLTGEFPLNVRLGEERLATLLGVSRTPVREALLRLDTEGLLARSPDGGWCPVAPDVPAVRQLYEARMALELAALRRPSETGHVHDAEALEALRDQWRELDTAGPEPDPGFVEVDESFHMALARAAGNDVLVDLLNSVNERIRLVRMHDFLTPGRVVRTVAQHLGILEAVLGGDLRTAELRFAHHLGESMAVVEERATQALARMASGTALVWT